MNSLPTLLKVAQRRIDEIARQMAEVSRRAADLRQSAQGLTARMAIETASAAGSGPEAMAMLPAYQARMRAQIAKVEQQVAGEDAVIATLRAKLMEAYREKAKLEQLVEQYTARRDAERASAEQNQLDEAALQLTFRRR